jgi:3-dehydroquinate dehydratase-2
MNYHNIVILNGPNLNLLGTRQPEIYGNQSFEEYFQELVAKFPHKNLAYEQTNHEGKLIDLIQEYGLNTWGIVINGAGYTHTSVALRDSISAVPAKCVEVHISDISKREDFRKFSYLTEVCDFHVIGKGIAGYQEAVEWLINQSM